MTDGQTGVTDMAMVVKNNVAAQMALGELRKNNDKLSKDLKQVASGMKINGAGDGAAACR